MGLFCFKSLIVKTDFLAQTIYMKSTRPYAILLIIGLASLYYGIDSIWAGYTVFGGVCGFIGFALSFGALSQMGDQRSDHSKYRNCPKNPTHIPSMPDGEYTGEGHGTTIMNEQAMAEIRQLVEGHRIIDAIKVYRQVTGHGLRESKEYIDSVVRQIELEERSK